MTQPYDIITCKSYLYNINSIRLLHILQSLWPIIGVSIYRHSIFKIDRTSFFLSTRNLSVIWNSGPLRYLYNNQQWFIPALAFENIIS